MWVGRKKQISNNLYSYDGKGKIEFILKEYIVQERQSTGGTQEYVSNGEEKLQKK